MLVELDGASWRTIPLDVAARSGLSIGLELDRERLRTLRRELQRAAALDLGVRALSRRDRSERALKTLLERKDVPAKERERTIETLRRHGALDDERFAHDRAAALAERGFGDEAIGFRLEQDGIDAETRALALAALEPEHDRAVRLVARRGATAKTARWLAGRGFTADSVEAVVPAVAETGAP